MRYGFVSNSSSTSFTCVKCGETGGGFDVDIEDCAMVECERGHIFCRDCIDDDLSELWEAKREESNEENINYMLPEECCPVCQMRLIPPNEIDTYLYKKMNINKKELGKEILDSFKNYKEFREYINESRTV